MQFNAVSKTMVLGAASAAVLVVATASAFAQVFPLRQPTGGRQCTTGEYNSCVRCCQSMAYGSVCENSCENAKKSAGKSDPQTKSRQRSQMKDE